MFAFDSNAGLIQVEAQLFPLKFAREPAAFGGMVEAYRAPHGGGLVVVRHIVGPPTQIVAIDSASFFALRGLVARYLRVHDGQSGDELISYLREQIGK